MTWTSDPPPARSTERGPFGPPSAFQHAAALRRAGAPCDHPRVRGRRGDTSRNVGAVLANRGLRRVLLAFAVFRPTESAQWIAILVYAYTAGGTREMGIAAVALLVPAGAAGAVRLAARRPHASGTSARARLPARWRRRPGLTAVALAASSPTWTVLRAAALVNISITMTRPTHLSILPELAETPGAADRGERVVEHARRASRSSSGRCSRACCSRSSGPGLVFGVMSVVAAGRSGSLVAGGARAIPHDRAPRASRRRRARGVPGTPRRPGARLLLGFVAGQTVVIGALDVLTVVLAVRGAVDGASGPGVPVGRRRRRRSASARRRP